MNKVKNYIIGILFLFCGILSWQYSWMRDKRDSEQAQKEKWQGNYMESLKDNRTLTMTYREWAKIKRDSISTLLDSLKVKPKTVTKIVTQVIIQKETDTLVVEVVKIDTGTYKIKDSAPCFVWEGIATIYGQDRLDVKRTAFNYENKIIDVYHRKQTGKFLFFKFYSKKEIERTVIPKCGESYSETINIVK